METLDKMIEACRQQNILTIADEVMTGFGRTGELFASYQLRHKPDIICLAKGITGGVLPLGATACSKKIYEGFLSTEKQKALLHGHSYTANPLACTAALASLDLLLDHKCSQQRQMIADEHQKFCRRWESYGYFKRVESLGTILALEYPTDRNSYFWQGQSLIERFYLDRGIIVRPLGNILYLIPPYSILERELKSIYQAIEKSMEIFR